MSLVILRGGRLSTAVAGVALTLASCSRPAHSLAMVSPGPPPVVTPAASPPPVHATPRPTRDDTCAMIRCVALTFDDGPGRSTAALLDILRDRQVRATFFMLGEQARQYPALVRRVHAEGHVIGSHTQDHRRLRGLSAPQQRREVGLAAAALRAAGVPAPTLLRPPFGAFDTTTQQLKMPVVLWDVDSQDWQSKDPVKIRARVRSQVRPGSIVLLHDIHPTTVAAVAQVISDLQGAGYALVTVPQLLGASPAAGTVVHHGRR